MSHACGLCEPFKEATLPWQVSPAVLSWHWEEKRIVMVIDYFYSGTGA